MLGLRPGLGNFSKQVGQPGVGPLCCAIEQHNVSNALHRLSLVGATNLLNHCPALFTIRNLHFDLDEFMGFKSAMDFLSDVLGQPFLCNDN